MAFTSEITVKGRSHPIDLDEVGAILLAMAAMEHNALHGGMPGGVPGCLFCAGADVDGVLAISPEQVRMLIALSAAQNEDGYDPDMWSDVDESTDVAWSLLVDEDEDEDDLVPVAPV